MSTCNGCGGVIGRDCFNPSECEWIAHDMESRERRQNQQSIQNLEEENRRLKQRLDRLEAVAQNQPNNTPL